MTDSIQTDMDNGQDAIYGGEPEGGWVAAPTLHDSVVTSLTLCKFTGLSFGQRNECAARELGGHPDEDCAAVYVLRPEIEPAGTTTTSLAGDDPTLTT